MVVLGGGAVSHERDTPVFGEEVALAPGFRVQDSGVCIQGLGFGM